MSVWFVLCEKWKNDQVVENEQTAKGWAAQGQWEAKWGLNWRLLCETVQDLITMLNTKDQLTAADNKWKEKRQNALSE